MKVAHQEVEFLRVASLSALPFSFIFLAVLLFMNYSRGRLTSSKGIVRSLRDLSTV
jgi:hypothetical protein